MRVIYYLSVVLVIIFTAGIVIELALGKGSVAGGLFIWAVIFGLIAYYLKKKTNNDK